MWIPLTVKPAYSQNMSARHVARVLLGSALTVVGISHLTVARKEFQAQVPEFVPLDPDTTVVASGVAEIGLGAALLWAKRRRGLVGVVVALFFVAIFPGNISQFLNERDGFGLDTDGKRFARLFFQPVLVWLAIWSTRTKK